MISDPAIIFLASKLHVFVVLGAVTTFFLLERSQQMKLLWTSLFVFPLSFALGKLGSTLVLSPRPFVVNDVQPLIQHVTDNGFPSEHTLLVMTVAGIVFTQNKSVGLVLFILGSLVGVGRIMADVHHSIDVIGASIIAFAAVGIVHYALPCALRANGRR